jgi:hypothetical protein
MVSKIIKIKNKRYYFYDKYSSHPRALAMAKLMRKLHNSRYYIVPTEDYWTARALYLLYFDNIAGGLY